MGMEGISGASLRRAALFVAASAAIFLVLAPSAGAQEEQSRYSLAGGCYTLASADGQPIVAASQLRFQATDLGSYLLYGTAEDFLAASGNDVVRAGEPSPEADWAVEDAGPGVFTFSPASAPDQVMAADGGDLTLVPREGAGSESHLRAVPAEGCAAYPEAQLNVTGTPATGNTPYGEVEGVLDGHMHWMTFEYLGGNFHCGRPWHRYGIPSALPDCAEIEGPQGAAAPMQNFLNYGSPVAPHDTTGWPELTEWGRDNLTYEGTYYRWLERAWMSGLRMIMMPINENRELCQLVVNRRNPCDEMNTVMKGLDDINELQDYVDAQMGGPGEGFFQIVRNPFQARRVINEGKMAVVLEVEVSELFGCHGSDPSSCSRDIVDRGLDELHQRGVRSSLLLNKFDNPLTGVRFDSGQVGMLINAANRDSYGSFWSAETCRGAEHDNTIESGFPEGSAFLAQLLGQLGVTPGTAPVYPPAPHCNTRGLTSLGAHTVRRMMDMGMIVNPDHMSQKAVDETLTLAEGRDYSGIISPHGWMDPRNWPRIFQLGGMAFPGAGDSEGFVDAWRTYRPRETPFYSGWGYGADLGGLANQGAPAAPGSPNSVTYPFQSIDGATTVDKQVTGNRTFDYSQEGVAHYGLYADWYEEVRKTGGQPIADDMLRGSEAYLQMWERAVGIRDGGCKSASQDFSGSGLGRIQLGMAPKDLLERAGQPISRERAWSWCVSGNANRDTSNTAVLTPEGPVALVASTAPGNQLRAIGTGDSAARLNGVATPAGDGLWTANLRASKAAYLVRDGKVVTVAVATAELGGNPAELRDYLMKVPEGGVTQRPDHVVNAGSSDVSPKQATPLVAKDGSGGAQFPLFCGL